MKRLFVSLMVIGGFILFGMQAAESASKGRLKLEQLIRRLTQRAERCAKRAKTEKENKRCFDRLAMEESKTARLRREKACRELSPVAKKACLRRFFVEFRAKQRVLARSRGTLIFLLAPKCGKLNPKAKAACLLARARVKDRVRTPVKDRVRARVKDRVRTRVMGSGKVRPDRGLRRCDKIRNPGRRAECRTKVRKRLVRTSRGGGGRMKADRARKRCSNIKSLRARAACCAKIRPASRLSPKKKLCRARARAKAN